MRYADVVATLALFAALGGTSYAAVQVTGKGVRNESLTSADVKNGTLLAKDFKKGELPGKPVNGSAGPAGGPGATGAPGTAGAQGAPGPSAAFAITGEVSSQGGVGTQTLPLSAGKFSVTATANLSHFSTTATGVVCSLVAGGTDAELDKGIITLPPSNGSSLLFATQTLQGTVSLPANGSVQLRCTGPTGTSAQPTGLTYIDFDISAVRVDEVFVTNTSTP